MALVGGIVAAGTSIYSIAESEKQKGEAKDAINAFNRQDLVNPFESIKIDTTAEDLALDKSLSSQATSVEALQRGGTRTVLGGVPKLQESSVLLNNQILASINQKAAKRDYAIANAELRNTALQERREEQALQGLGQAYQTARQDTVTGVTNALSGGLAIASAINPETGGVNFDGRPPRQDKINDSLFNKADTVQTTDFSNSIFTETNPFANPNSDIFGQQNNPFLSFTNPAF
ncbi:MAG: hypothetical protein QM499_00925 [Flavobacteriaceae bacterium]